MSISLRDLNVCVSAPGLAIHGSASTVVKYANTFQFKSNGRLSDSITTADAPGLDKATLIAPYPGGVASKPGALAAGFYRIYTLVADLPQTGAETPTVTYSWLSSADFDETADQPNLDNAALPDKATSCAIGFVIVVNDTTSAFTPGTTALDASNLNVTYMDNYAGIGL